MTVLFVVVVPIDQLSAVKANNALMVQIDLTTKVPLYSGDRMDIQNV